MLQQQPDESEMMKAYSASIHEKEAPRLYWTTDPETGFASTKINLDPVIKSQKTPS
jgi:hypothetical protein